MKLRKGNRQSTRTPWSLRRVLLLLLLVAVLPSLSIQAVLVGRWRASNRREQALMNLEVARAAAELFQGYVADLARTEGAIAESLTRLRSDAPEQIDEMLAAQVAEYPSVSTLSLVNIEGEVVASSRSGDVGLQVGDRPYLQRALKAGPDGWVVSDLLISRGSGETVVIVARAVYANGRPVGILAALVEPERLARAAVQLRRVEGGTILLFDRSGRLVYRNPPVDLIEEQAEAYREPMLRAALEGREARGVFVSPINGERMFVARVPTGGLGWVAGAGRRIDQVNAPVWAAVRDTLGVNLALLGGCVGVLLLTGWAIRRDASGLNHQMTAAARGEPAPAEPLRIGEFRRLSEGFAAASDERVKAEQALRDSEATLNAVLDALPVGVIIADATGRIVRVNAVTNSIWGVPPETTSWEQYDRWVGWWGETGDRIESHEWAMARALREGQTSAGELIQIQPFDGSPRRFILNSAAPVRDSAGEIIAGVVALQDVTERTEAQEALRESEQRYRSLFNNNHAVMLLLDPAAGQIADANPAAVAFYGYSAERLKTMRITEINALPDEEVRRRMRQAREGRRRSFRFAHRLASGEVRNVQVYSGPINVRGRQLIYSIIHDVTDQVRAEEELQQVVEELRRSNEDLQQFAYVASHDLREPLRMVAGFATLLKDRFADQLGPEGNEFIAFAVDGATRMQHLLDGLLAYSRVSTRAEPPAPAPMREAFEAALANLWGQVRESDGEVTADELPTVRADRTQMVQLLQNLIANALKFRREGVPPRVHVSVERADGQWLFRVADNGIGIDPRHAERIFLVFNRLHPRDRYGGTGVGLAICKKIVERHGGRMWVESTLGEGATFCFTLPVAEE
ncbi:MAG: PAS domain S-box protein [Planctomycetota bacterium]